MKLTSSQRWAVGAVALAVLLACSPPTPDPPEEPAQPTPQPPSLSQGAASAVPTSGPLIETQSPGFAGEWAFAQEDCAEPAKTFKLSADRIVMSPGERSCKVKSILEDHPTGRSAVYAVTADCLAEGEASEDRFTLNFGAADTVMQLQLNGRDPVRLVRCP
jgi:hypothetical protein